MVVSKDAIVIFWKKGKTSVLLFYFFHWKLNVYYASLSFHQMWRLFWFFFTNMERWAYLFLHQVMKSSSLKLASGLLTKYVMSIHFNRCFKRKLLTQKITKLIKEDLYTNAEEAILQYWKNAKFIQISKNTLTTFSMKTSI